VLDENDEFQIAMDLGVDGIMTDYPTKMIEYLKKSPVYSDLIFDNEKFG
jgi:glycerophosphoryl diester phosphodiesterase